LIEATTAVSNEVHLSTGWSASLCGCASADRITIIIYKYIPLSRYVTCSFPFGCMLYIPASSLLQNLYYIWWKINACRMHCKRII